MTTLYCGTLTIDTEYREELDAWTCRIQPDDGAEIAVTVQVGNCQPDPPMVAAQAALHAVAPMVAGHVEEGAFSYWITRNRQWVRNR